MAIERGQQWGSQLVVPVDLVQASSDVELAEYIARGKKNIAVTDGDMWRTIGAGAQVVAAGEMAMCLPIDVMKVDYQIDGIATTKLAVAHVVTRESNTRGGWLRGEVSVIANAQFLDRWDIAPRGHPNDGRVELTQVNRAMGVRQRVAARPRLRTGTHIPHPLIETKSVKSFERCFAQESRQILWIDRQCIGRVQRLSIEVMSDEAFLWM